MIRARQALSNDYTAKIGVEELSRMRRTLTAAG